MFNQLPPIPMIIAQILVLFLGIGLHEYAHCKFADMAGDPTPRLYGRVTLNLTKHFEPMGTLMMVLTTLTGYGIGWGRAAPANPSKMRNPRWDFFVSVAAGPISNLLQAVIYGFLFRISMKFGLYADANPSFFVEVFQNWFLFGILINLGLCLFNLIPFGPLDGHWLVGLLLPEKQRYYYFKFNDRIGMPGLFIAVILLRSANISLTMGPVLYLFKIIAGPNPFGLG